MIDGDGGSDCEVIGEVTTKMGHLVGAPDQVFKCELTATGHTGSRGSLIVRTEAEVANKDLILMEYKWTNIRNMAGCLCKSA